MMVNLQRIVQGISLPSKFILGALVAVLAILAGVSGLIYPSLYSPLIFLGGIVVFIALLAWLVKPVWALYGAVFVVFLPVGLIPSTIHSLLNRSITVIALGVWLVRLFQGRKKVVLTTSAVFMVFFLVWSTITLFWAGRVNPAVNALQVYLLRFLLFMFLIPNEISTRRDLDGLMKVLALCGWVLMLSFIGTLSIDGYTAGSSLRIFSENNNGLGVIALISMVGITWLALSSNNTHRILRTLMIAIYLLLTIGLVVMSASRGSTLSFLVSLGVFWLWKPLRPWAKLGYFVVFLALIFTPTIFTTLFERFTIQRTDTLLGGREVLWEAAWHLVQDHPLNGVGIGNAPNESLKYLQMDRRMVGAEIAVIHNPILTVWSETAALGIFLYLGVLISSIFSFIKQFLKFKNVASHTFILYYALVSSIALGYFVSWFKGGGMESHFSYFLILALLSLPSVLDIKTFGKNHPTADSL